MDVIKLLGGVEKMKRDLARHEKEAADALSPREPYKNAALFLKECGLRLRLCNGCVQYNEHPPGVKVGWFAREPVPRPSPLRSTGRWQRPILPVSFALSH